MEAELQQIRDLVGGADLSPDVRDQSLRALDQLPKLYAEFGRTYDIRYRNSIADHVQGIMNTLAKQKCPDASRVLERLFAGLQAMHERLAIPSLGLKMPGPAKRTRKAA